MAGTKTIGISEESWQQLTILKALNKAESLDAVIRSLLEKENPRLQLVDASNQKEVS